MADYLPRHKPGQAVTSKASATITAGQLLIATGVNTVGPAGAAAKNCVGVAAFGAANTEYLTYFTGGVQILLASGAITAGDPVIAGAAGTVVSSATPPLAQKVGVALTTGTDVVVDVAMTSC